MSAANVQNVRSLESFQSRCVTYAEHLIQETDQLRMLVNRLRQRYADEWPRYWNAQIRLTERQLGEAKDRLQAKRAAVRAVDRLPASEEAAVVNRLERRLRSARQRAQQCKSVLVIMEKAIDDTLGPIADLAQHGEIQIPVAAHALRQLIDLLKRYLDAETPPSS
ncbi:MAG: hypothetical protein AAF958_12040 [Planctomycetota bacterium]